MSTHFTIDDSMFDRIRTRMRGLVACLLVGSVAAIAGGHLLTQQAPRFVGMGDIGVAPLGEPVALSANPASLAFAEETMLSLGTTIIMPDTRFSPDGAADIRTKSQVLFPPSVLLSHSFGRIAAGFSAGTPYSVRTEWGEDWPGASTVVSDEFRVVSFSPGIAWQVARGFALGAAVNLSYLRLTGSRKTLLPGTQIASVASFDAASGLAAGVTVGVQFRPVSRFSVGASYTTSLSLSLENATASYLRVPDSLAARYSTWPLTATFRTPPQLNAGITVRPFGIITLEVDAHRIFWSRASGALSGGDLTGLVPTAWRDTWTFNAGMELDLGGTALRGGYLVDESPVPDGTVAPSFPDATRRGFALGVGYWVSEGLRLDFSYQRLTFDERRTSFPATDPGVTSPVTGVLRSTWTVLGINVSYFWE